MSFELDIARKDKQGMWVELPIVLNNILISLVTAYIQLVISGDKIAVQKAFAVSEDLGHLVSQSIRFPKPAVTTMGILSLTLAIIIFARGFVRLSVGILNIFIAFSCLLIFIFL